MAAATEVIDLTKIKLQCECFDGGDETKWQEWQFLFKNLMFGLSERMCEGI
jgi:hypothetical protein